MKKLLSIFAVIAMLNSCVSDPIEEDRKLSDNRS